MSAISSVLTLLFVLAYSSSVSRNLTEFGEEEDEELTKESYDVSDAEIDRDGEKLIRAPTSLSFPLQPVSRILMSGGFANPCPSVLDTMLTHVTTIRESVMLRNEIVDGLRYAFQTKNEMTFPLTGTGLVGMNSVLLNLVEPNDTVIVGVSGYWAQRAAEYAKRIGARVIRLRKSAGETFSLGEISAALKRHKPVVLYLVHGVSSTGAVQDMDGIGTLCRKHGSLFVVDAVSTFAEMPLYVDAWKIDAAFSNTQKGLGSLVGLAPITFGRRALARYLRRKSSVPAEEMDLSFMSSVWVPKDEAHRMGHYTFPLQQLYALREALSLLVGETLPQKWARVSEAADLLVARLRALGLKPFVAKREKRLLSIMTFTLPQNIDVLALNDFALKRYKMDMTPGYYGSANYTLRIGLLGCNANPENVNFAADVVADGLRELPGKSIPGQQLIAF